MDEFDVLTPPNQLGQQVIIENEREAPQTWSTPRK